MKIGIIGTGNIATYLLEKINDEKWLNGEVIALFGRNREVGENLATRYGIDFHTEFQDFLDAPITMVVEAATIEAANHYIKAVVTSKKDLIVSSIGVFNDIQLLDELKELAESNGVQVSLPSGAIGGLDLLKSANAVNGLKHVQITTRKSPASLGLQANHGEELLFDGSAREAIPKFPRNMNVALVLALAGIGIEKTRVQVVVDPAVKRNTHVIEADGDFGNMKLQIENNPMPNNPKTSHLAALSILDALKNKDYSIRIGN
ncbi:aspartate dehydrogenase [Sporosarcina aquimarina]|uniref:aspartate dehydrogenase n=1 Tax=Sporosarcina aquimarina TaxID=114975 RepID=UPI00203E83B7|nr:aspartate dehydrogenase [Sporosarcina aquimarina]MCM3758560.1 aspartate dehydrogenase [Sporosarcina aquimarina]